MMERLDGEAVGIHPHRLRLARAGPGHVELIHRPFLGGPREQWASIPRRRHRHPREMHLVARPGALDLEARAPREPPPPRAFRGGGERAGPGERRGHRDDDGSHGEKHSIAHGSLLYLIWNWTGSRTHMATGSLPRRAGSKRHRRTASMAAWSTSG